MGQRRPTLDQCIRIAKALEVPIQRLIGGSDRPGTELREIAIELRHLGMVDLWVKDAVVPGAFRRAEEVIALAVAGHEPEPRLVEAIPAVLAWNPIDPILLRAYGLTMRPRTARRLAWLADVALAIDRRGGFPGGCRKEPLARLVRIIRAPLARTRSLGLSRTPDGEATDVADLETMEDQLRRESGCVRAAGQASGRAPRAIGCPLAIATYPAARRRPGGWAH